MGTLRSMLNTNIFILGQDVSLFIYLFISCVLVRFRLEAGLILRE
jgi:hypothetical protein